MGPVNWLAVILAANLAVAVGMVWHGPLFRSGRPLLGDSAPARGYAIIIAIMLIGAAMLGHNYARIGAETLRAKPWLYLMQSGGIALFFIVPATWLTNARQDVPARLRLVDAGYWLVAYLVMGAVFWALG